MQIVYTRKPKIHMLQNGKAVCGRHWLDGEEESSKFAAGSVDCKDCLRLLTKRAVELGDSAASQALSQPEVNLVVEAESNPAPIH